MNHLPKLICIVGPTASGKTALSIKLAKKIGGEIVSADSRQVYIGMDIGTAKPPLSFSPLTRGRLRRGGIPHHLIDIKYPNQPYTLAQYQKDANKAIEKILRSDKIPFLVGGTGLYVWAVINNLVIPGVKPNKKLRLKLERQMQKKGVNFLYQKLIKLDPEAAYVVDPKNPRRVIRALEVAILTGKPFSTQRKKRPKLYNTLILGINLSKEELKKRIAKRTKQMFKAGLVAEVRRLVKKYGKNFPAFDAIGYREVIDHDLKMIKKQIEKNTWRFAKRQMTWFRKMPVVWIRNQREAEKEIKEFWIK